MRRNLIVSPRFRQELFDLTTIELQECSTGPVDGVDGIVVHFTPEFMPLSALAGDEDPHVFSGGAPAKLGDRDLAGLLADLKSQFDEVANEGFDGDVAHLGVRFEAVPTDVSDVGIPVLITWLPTEVYHHLSPTASALALTWVTTCSFSAEVSSTPASSRILSKREDKKGPMPISGLE